MKNITKIRVNTPQSSTPEYRAWWAMRDRCTNPAHRNWANYGGRGITVCDRWMNSFDNFLEDMGPRPDGMSLDRIDNEKGYGPGNCRWTTMVVQNNNRRRRKDTNPNPKPIEHGTLRAYFTLRCRCDPCWRSLISESAKRPSVHGTFGYGQGCRCDRCRSANTDQCREGRLRKRGGNRGEAPNEQTSPQSDRPKPVRRMGRWSPEEVRFAVQETHLTASQVGKRIGRTAGGVTVVRRKFRDGNPYIRSLAEGNAVFRRGGVG